MADLDDKVVLVTGGTGSFGSRFVQHVLRDYSPKKVIVLSRDEMKQWEMAKKQDDPRIRYFLGDVRDGQRLARAFEGVDVVVHAAALKIVPTAEYNPFETVKTNIIGAMNVIDAALDSGVSRVVALSTDKASSPVNLYGATKLVSDKLFIAANSYGANSRTVFSVVRYGNVMASRGSIIPLFNEQASRGLITITDSRMTRFFLSLDEGIDLVLHALGDAVGGEIYVKKIPSANVIDVAEAVAPGSEISIVGVRPGEKLHEQMIGSEESHMCLEFEGHFVIYPNASSQDKGRLKGGQSVAESFSYSSETNQHWLDVSQLRKKIEGLTDAS